MDTSQPQTSLSVLKRLIEALQSITLTDLIPPIFFRLYNKFLYKTFNSKKRLPPFCYIPADVDPNIILDIGANYGHVAKAALKSFPKAKLICFEPVKSTLDALRIQLAPYSDRLEIYAQALSNQTGTLDVNIVSHHGANSIEMQSEFHKVLNPHIKELSKEKIDVIRLDDFTMSKNIQKYDIVKIDVEGHELSTLQGGEITFKERVDVLIIEVSFQRDSSWENQSFLKLFNLLHSWGFRLVNIYDVYNNTSDKSKTNMMLSQFDAVFRHSRNLK